MHATLSSPSSKPCIVMHTVTWPAQAQSVQGVAHACPTGSGLARTLRQLAAAALVHAENVADGGSGVQMVMGLLLRSRVGVAAAVHGVCSPCTAFGCRVCTSLAWVGQCALVVRLPRTPVGFSLREPPLGWCSARAWHVGCAPFLGAERICGAEAAQIPTRIWCCAHA